MIGRHIRPMVLRRPGRPAWGWDFGRPIEVHGYEVSFSDRGLHLCLVDEDGDTVFEGVLPFLSPPPDHDPADASSPWERARAGTHGLVGAGDLSPRTLRLMDVLADCAARGEALRSDPPSPPAGPLPGRHAEPVRGDRGAGGGQSASGSPGDQGLSEVQDG